MTVALSPHSNLTLDEPLNGMPRHAVAVGDFPSARAVFAARKGFAAAWSGFVQDTFPSARAAAAAFGVDGKTSRDWWHARGAPSGFAVALAFRAAPMAAAKWLINAGGWLIGHSALPA